MIYLRVGALAQTDKVKEFISTFGCLGFGNPIIAGIDDEISSNIEVRIKIIFLWNYADQRADFTTLGANIETFNQQFAGSQRRATGNHTHHRRLSGAVRSQQTKRLSATY